VKFLDELAFEQKRLRLALHHVHVRKSRMASTSALNFRSQPIRRDGWKILADALAQVAGLADVNDRAEPVAHEIHARLVRPFADFLADGFGRSTAEFQTQSRQDAKGKFLLAWRTKSRISRQIEERKSMLKIKARLRRPSSPHRRQRQ